jgi:cell division inhibitor SepF
MSALHRLKAYFGMVPAEEFDAAEFDDYDDGFATRAGHHAAPRMHPTRSPSWATEHRAAESRATDPWTTEAPVRGSLAIDTSTINPRSTVRQPVAPHRVTPVPRTGPPAEDPLGEDRAHPLARIVTLHPHNYNEARPIGERYREGNPVIMNLTEMEDRDAKRLVDFAAGLAFALRGSIDKVTNKVFLLSPPNVDVSAEDRRRIAEGRFFI